VEEAAAAGPQAEQEAVDDEGQEQEERVEQIPDVIRRA
jgi:hypothetical protein